MKSRFTTIDIIAVLKEIQSFIGLRVNQVYDIDNKTYLFKLSSKDAKAVLLMESGLRLHMTEFDWPKSNSPSGFTMKLRKHIHNRRLESAQQLGVDRIVDLQFGSGEAAYHVILELYDKGNIVLTDYQYNTLNILRPRTEGEDVKFAVRNVYPTERAKQDKSLISINELEDILSTAKTGENLKRVLNPKLIYGPALIEHVLMKHGLQDKKVGKTFDANQDMSNLLEALKEADFIINDIHNSQSKGFIIKKIEKRPAENGQTTEFLVNNEFHPFLYRQHEKFPFEEFPSFNKSVDEFFSKLESQKIDMKAIQMEKDALKKLDNIKIDHEKRIEALEQAQEEDRAKAQLIEMNLEFVDKAITVVLRAIANQISWKDIAELLQEAKLQGDPVASAIQDLKLNINHITMLLSDPYACYADEDDEESYLKSRVVDIDLDLTAFANAKKYYVQKKHAAHKEQKTIDSSKKAFKSAEKKTKQTLKEVATVTNIKKSRKIQWFEKFYWFISSENYLVIGGRDQQQNEIIVKRYLRSGDVYVHADLHGASSIVIKNPNKSPIPPKTLNEAGTMAVCYSSAWDAKVLTSAYWVNPEQVSKTAPTGEYLTTGSFMIRGKKNYLPPCHLIMGFGLIFKLGEESILNHIDERKVKITEDDSSSIHESINNEDEEIALDEESDEEIAGPQEPNEQIEEAQENEEPSFPDTIIEMEHLQGDQYTIRHRTVSTASEKSEEDVVYLGDKVPVQLQPALLKQSKKEKTPQSKDNSKTHNDDSSKNQENTEKTKSAKRGQKFRQKRMQEKYKDQDEDDRALALDLLKPDGPVKEPKHKAKKVKGQGNQPKTKPIGFKKPPEQLGIIHENETTGNNTIAKPAEADEESDNEQEQLLMKEDALLLSSLTGIPLSDDVLLYSIPTCAPYNCLSNYKYKVKLTPGTGKRGKAVKTALAMFLHDKNGNQREKDLVKSLKDQDAARNIPGKVKMSAPQLMRLKNR